MEVRYSGEEGRQKERDSSREWEEVGIEKGG